MQIGYLADHQDFMPTLAQWLHREWAHLYRDDSVEAWLSRLRARCGHRRVPTVVVAFADGALLGLASLLAHDMDTRTDFSPWLAGVFVAPEYRRQGVGAWLVQRIIDEATGLGVRRLYLTLRAQNTFIYASVGRSRSVRATGKQRWR